MTEAGKIALVTGAGTGIGKYTALALLDAGYKVVLSGRRQDKLESAVENAKAKAHSLCVSCDVSDPVSVKNLFDKTLESFGRLDLLFNNAGVGAAAIPLEDLPFSEWQKVIAINLTGAFLCTQQAFRIMKNQSPMGGRIINNGSVSAHAPRPSSAPYTASKHAITGLTKASSLDGRNYNIACGQIDIGNAETDMTMRMKTGILQADGSLKAEATMNPEDVAKAIVYMASLPLEANVQFMTIMASKMPFIGRG